METSKAQITLLAKMIEDANKATKSMPGDTTFGRCDWTDINGDERCNSPWSEFQRQQAGGVFTPDAKCDD